MNVLFDMRIIMMMNIRVCLDNSLLSNKKQVFISFILSFSGKKLLFKGHSKPSEIFLLIPVVKC